jgi:hypothetical protein
MEIAAFEKAAGAWCGHCPPGHSGCKIYDTRPEECRNFYCQWLLYPGFGPEWYPLDCKMILLLHPHKEGLVVHVDPDFPDAWRNEPYHRQLRQWAFRGRHTGMYVAVWIKTRRIVILPDRDIDLGEFDPGDRIEVRLQKSVLGQTWSAVRISVKEAPFIDENSKAKAF